MIYRRGRLYLVYESPERGFIYDPALGRASGVIPALFLGDSAREWRWVPDSAALPEGLTDLLVIPFPTPGGGPTRAD